MTSRAPLALVGPGSAGSSLVAALSRSGWPLLGVLARTTAGADAAAKRLGVPSLGSSADPEVGLDRAEILVLAVHDDAIADLAEVMAARGDWRSRCVLHLSGGLGSAALAPFARRGAHVASFHPLMTFVQSESAPAAHLPEDTPFFVEGDETARKQCEELAVALGVVSHVLSPESKALYHCAATMAGNFVTSLLASAGELLAAAGVPQGSQLLAPLARESAAAAGLRKPSDALTGPIARGDVKTLAAHFDALQEAEISLETRSVHLILSEATAALAGQGGRVDPARMAEILGLLASARQLLLDGDEALSPRGGPGTLESDLPGETE